MFKKNENKPKPDMEYYAIYDSKMGEYSDREPITAQNRIALIRAVTALFNNPQEKQNPLLVNAEDFQIFKIGEYTKRTATIAPCHPEHILNLHELKSAIQLDEQRKGIAST